MSEMVREIRKDEFEREVKSCADPAVLEFYAADSPQCTALAAEYESIAAQLGDRVRCFKISLPDSGDLARRLGVSTSPTLLFYRSGLEVSERLVGDVTPAALKKAAEGLVPKR